MSRPRRAAPRWRHRDGADALILAAGVGAGVLMMLVGWAPTVDVPAPMPGTPASVAAATHGSAGEPDAPLARPAPSPDRGTGPSHAAPVEVTETRGPGLGAPDGDAPTPNELSIPSLGIRAPLDAVRVADGALTIPDDPSRVGRWTGGADLHDQAGAVLLSGHVAWAGTRGALWGLASAEPGAEVVVTDATGRPTMWQVIRVWAVKRGTALPELFRTTGAKRLVVVTCGGRVVGGHYSHNVIVEAAPIPAT